MENLLIIYHVSEAQRPYGRKQFTMCTSPRTNGLATGKRRFGNAQYDNHSILTLLYEAAPTVAHNTLGSRCSNRDEQKTHRNSIGVSRKRYGPFRRSTQTNRSVSWNKQKGSKRCSVAYSSGNHSNPTTNKDGQGT